MSKSPWERLDDLNNAKARAEEAREALERQQAANALGAKEQKTYEASLALTRALLAKWAEGGIDDADTDPITQRFLGNHLIIGRDVEGDYNSADYNFIERVDTAIFRDRSNIFSEKHHFYALQDREGREVEGHLYAASLIGGRSDYLMNLVGQPGPKIRGIMDGIRSNLSYPILKAVELQTEEKGDRDRRPFPEWFAVVTPPQS